MRFQGIVRCALIGLACHTPVSATVETLADNNLAQDLGADEGLLRTQLSGSSVQNLTEHSNGISGELWEPILRHPAKANLTLPKVFLAGVSTAISIDLPAQDERMQVWDAHVPVMLDVISKGVVTHSMRFTLNTSNLDKHYNLPILTHSLEGIVFDDFGVGFIKVKVEGLPEVSQRTYSIPAWLSMLPPLVTLVISVALRQVMIALTIGVWVGCIWLYEYNVVIAFMRTFDEYVSNAFMSDGHANVILFTFFLGGLIGLVQKSGGALGLARQCVKVASTPKRGQLMCWFLGVGIFYDDYSCVLITGNSLRPITRSIRMSPEKFAYIIHTCAQMASMTPVSSWIGVELGYLQQQYKLLGVDQNAFLVLMKTIPYRIYPIISIFFALAVIALGKDFGPMATAEKNFHKLIRRDSINGGSDPNRLLTSVPSGSFSTDDGESGGNSPIVSDDNSDEDIPALAKRKPERVINAVLPFGTVIVATMVGIVYDGYIKIPAGGSHDIIAIVSSANSVSALYWASVLGCVVAAIMYTAQKLLSLSAIIDSWVEGVKDVLEPTLVLLLAWALGSVIQDLNTANYLVSALGSSISVQWLPAIVAVFAYVISFATGTSFGTMGVLFPLAVPLAYQVSGNDEHVMLLATSAILGGSLFGNHCSPIADLTILSSMSAGCEVGSHFETTFPYAALVGLVSLVFGFMPLGFFPSWYSPWLALLVCLLVCVGVLMLLGGDTEERRINALEEEDIADEE
ncbi:hypothetical protein SARC_01233 [Sphaeroforma arctica JP610]|uniref:Na+/H+ antiporter NhaC-like C-terminal domain-containing protein n=1 Tax=Sphaeroforma arctica JP610 TaxID=667725 RepID=A0A0L0GEE2_9EUKA|nr:hypothetical protein SARC_01233 [Sphaeroforma arctica JP610]KNC86603.1 hypothetical protein SARC_01233 [Sphaeroforma arctica JP610]|eukprot:XP_014160505.1 hypothetical protein SARC_01233 [Sphaeroforma arctica JP610]